MLVATSLRKQYENRDVLHEVSLEIADGEFLSIMGKSGSGKSTLLNILAGNVKPDSGSVCLDGKEITAMNEKALAKWRRTELGFVYQALNLIPTLNAVDNMLLPLYLDRKADHDAKKRMEELCDALQISHLFCAFPDQMSGGERQRVAIARAMLHEPRVLMLDEPTGSLDSQSTMQVMELLCRLHREKGVSIIQVTHSREAAEYGTRILELADGQVVYS